MGLFSRKPKKEAPSDSTTYYVNGAAVTIDATPQITVPTYESKPNIEEPENFSEDVLKAAVEEALELSTNAKKHVPSFKFGANTGFKILRQKENTGKQPYKEFFKIDLGVDVIDVYIYPDGGLFKYSLYTHPNKNVMFTVSGKRFNQNDELKITSISIEFN